MARQQSGVKRKGTEVLLGSRKSIPDQSELLALGQASRPAVEPPAAPPTASQEAFPAEGDEGSALYEEALAAGTAHAAIDAPWLEAADWPPSAEAELAVTGHDRVAQAASSAPSIQTRSVLSTPISAETVKDIWDLQEPEVRVEPVELPGTPLPPEQEEALTAAASDRIAKLNAEIDEVYEQVLREVGDNESIANECYNALLKARDIVLRNDVSRLAQAEYYVRLARARLKRASVSATGAKKHAWWIFAWGLVWGMVYAAAIVLLDSAYVQDSLARLNLRTSVVEPAVLLPSMVWGGIGGVLAIWYSLFKHVSARDFDDHYNISYLGKPFFGLVLGATVYMIVSLLVTSLGVWPSGMTNPASGEAVPLVTPWIIYFVAMVAGFKENRVFGVVDQIMKWIFPERSSSTTAEGEPM